MSITSEKAHNKNITKLFGLEPFGFSDINKLSEKFKLKFACSCTVNELPGKVSPGKVNNTYILFNYIFLIFKRKLSCREMFYKI